MLPQQLARARPSTRSTSSSSKTWISSPDAGVQRTRRTAACRSLHVVVVARLGRPARVHRRVERPVRQVDARDRVGERLRAEARSARATAGRTTRESRSRACDSEIFSGSSDSGRNASLTCSYGTSGDEPQKSQRWPTLSASNTEIAWQLWHLTEVFVGLPAARRVGNAAQRRDQIVLDDDGRRRRASRASPATRCRRTDRSSACLRGIPVRFGAAGRAVELLRAPSRPRSGRRSSPRRRLTESRSLLQELASCARVMRHCVPIFLPLRSPASRLAMTSASLTPSAFAASAGPERLGQSPAQPAPRRRPASSARRCRPADSSSAAPSRSRPPSRRRRRRRPLPPFSMPCAIWYFT